MKTRNSNIELLRIISMMMIMVLHFLGHSKNVWEGGVSADMLLWNLNESICISAIAIFVLISGYFGIRFTFRKLLRLYLQCLIWGVVGYLLYVLCANTPPRENNNIIRSSSCLYTQQILVYRDLFGINVFSSDTQCGNRIF